MRILRRPLVLLLAGLLGAAGCSSTGSGGTPTPGATTASQPGGTLVAAIDSDPGGLNPAVTTSGATHTAAELMFNGLVELDDTGRPVPELAQSWTVSDNGATYTFRLRAGVRWHDGASFTSADVKYTFEQVLDKFHARTAASVGKSIQSVETPDAQTVVFRFRQPYAPLLQQLGVTEAPILPRHIYEGTDPQKNPANQRPVGTGPFKLESYRQGAEVSLVRNPDYFKRRLPRLDRVVLRVIASPASQVAALEAGEVDWLWGAPGPDLARLRANPAFRTLQTSVNPGGANCIMTVSFNLDRPLFADRRVRAAVGHALDRQQFLDRVLFGNGRVADAPISSGIPFAHATGINLPGFDPARAAALLDEAGWPRSGSGTRTARGVAGVADGTPLRFDFLAFPSFSRYAELFRAQLAQVGIDVTVKPLDPSAFSRTVFVDRNFDTNLISYCNGTDPEIGVRRMYDSASIQKVPFTNSSGYRNPTVDALFQRAATTVDQGRRGELYRQVQEQLARDLPYLWLVETTGTRVYTARCRDLSASGHFAEAATCTRPAG